MLNKSPIQFVNAHISAHSRNLVLRSRRYVCCGLTSIFAIVFAIAWFFDDTEPFATLNLTSEGDVVGFSPDGALFVTLTEGFEPRGPIRVWDVAKGQERFSVAANWKAIETVLFSPDCSLIAAHEQVGDLKIWNTGTGEEVATIKTETKFGNRVNFCFSPDGHFLVFQDFSKGTDNKDYFSFWNLESKRVQGTVESYIRTLVFAPDGNSFTTFRRKDYGEVNEVLLWKIDSVPVLVKQHRISARLVATSPDLLTFAAARDLPNGTAEIGIFDMSTGEKRWSQELNGLDGSMQTLSFMAQGKIVEVIYGGGSKLNWHWGSVLWDVSLEPKKLGSFSETPIVSPDGEWLAIPFDSGMRLLRVSSPEQSFDLVVSGDSVPTAIGTITGAKVLPTPSFSSDGKLMAVKGLYRFEQEPFLGKWLPRNLNPFRTRTQRLIRLWDADKHRELFTFNESRDIWFSPEQQFVATLRDDCQAVDFWKLPLGRSSWRVFCLAIAVWLTVVSVWWLSIKCKMTWKEKKEKRLP